MLIRYSLLASFVAVLCMRKMRGGWSKEQLRQDAFAVLLLTAVLSVATKVIGL